MLMIFFGKGELIWVHLSINLKCTIMKKFFKSPGLYVLLTCIFGLLLMCALIFSLVEGNYTQAEFDKNKSSLLEKLASDPTYQSFVVNSKKLALLINQELKAGKNLVLAFQKHEDRTEILTGQYQELEARYPDFMALDEQLMEAESGNTFVHRISSDKANTYGESGGCSNPTYDSCIRRAVSSFVDCRDRGEKPLAQCSIEYGQYVEMCVTWFCHL